VTERTLAYGIALLLVALCLVAMAGMHERHYKNRRWQMLEGRVGVIEKIITGDHD
jgi:hypothetical protein